MNGQPGARRVRTHLVLAAFVAAVIGGVASERGLAKEGQPRPLAADRQKADTLASPSVAEPAYPAGKGPVVLIDEAHGNYHTAKGRYRPFAELLERDGYVVSRQPAMFNATAFDPGTILVIANALAAQNQNDWSLPTHSAFKREEIEALRAWVEEGGSLLLIADHMPFGGAAMALGAAFGIHMADAYAMDSTLTNGILTFKRSNGSLASHAITNGRHAGERVDSLRAYSGQAFRAVGTAVEPLMLLSPNSMLLLPVKSEELGPKTPRISGAGMLQGAAFRYGRGRVAVFGEAAMFSAQTAGQMRFGFNDPAAPQNAQFALNVLHWLSGLLPES